MTIPDFLLPFGPLHLVFLHLPIGALVALCFVLFVLPNDGQKYRNSAIGFLHLFLLFSTAITLVLGLAYEVYGQYEEELDLHMLWGYIFGGAVLVNYILYWVHRMVAGRFSKYAYLLTLAFAAVAVTVTGHLGGELVHGKGFLTKPFQMETEVPVVVDEPVDPAAVSTVPAPDSAAVTAVRVAPPKPEPVMIEASSNIEMDVGERLNTEDSDSDFEMTGTVVEDLPEASDTEVDDASIELHVAAQLVFKNNCYNCHGATKQKGGLRLDREGDAFAGGDAGPISIVPHDVEGSLIIERMRLPRDDDDAMPPEKKPAVSLQDIEAIAAWIEAGAVWPDASARAKRSSTYVEVVDEAADDLIEKINATGAKAEYNSWDDTRIRVDLSFTDTDKLDTAIAQLGALGDQIFWLDAGGLTLPQSFYDQVAKLKNVERLYLNGTNIRDADLEVVAKLTKLTYLNLFNTQITNKGSEALKSLPNLQKVFLGETEVSKAAAKRLAETRDGLSVIHR